MYRRILVPIDGSPTARRGLDEAIALAREAGGAIRVLHVIDEPYAALGLDGFAAGASGDIVELLQANARHIVDDGAAAVRAAGVPVETAIEDSASGRVCELVAKDATDWRADLVVIGTHGRRGTRRLFLGSDAEQISRIAPVPVLLVRGAGPA
ncbi:MAG: universal stress protein [Burkholderiaceae bacterium]